MLFPLSEVGSTVGASSLPQGETADEPKGEQDDGQEDAQEGERVLQDPDPAETGGARSGRRCRGDAGGAGGALGHVFSQTRNEHQVLVPINTYILRTRNPSHCTVFLPLLESFRLIFPLPRGKFRDSDSLDCVWLLLWEEGAETTQVHTMSLTLGGLISKLLFGKFGKSHINPPCAQCMTPRTTRGQPPTTSPRGHHPGPGSFSKAPKAGGAGAAMCPDGCSETPDASPHPQNRFPPAPELRGAALWENRDPPTPRPPHPPEAPAPTNAGRNCLKETRTLSLQRPRTLQKVKGGSRETSGCLPSPGDLR